MIKTGTYNISEPKVKWDIPITPDQKFISIDGIYDSNKKIQAVEYKLTQFDSKVEIDFRYDTYSGYVRYSWMDDTEDSDDINNSVVINNNCNEGNMTDHEIINITDTRVIEIENKSIHSRQIKVYLFIGEVDGIKEYQDHTDAVDIFVKERISDGKKFIKVESNIPITGFIELY